MQKNQLLFDTNAFESENLFYSSNSKIYLSSIVLMELMTYCDDRKELKNYQKLWKQAVNDKRLIVPTEQDIFDASRIQFLLAQDRKNANNKKSPKLTSKAKQEIALDCLIAVSACREKVTVVTGDNDYSAIQVYLKSLKLRNL